MDGSVNQGEPMTDPTHLAVKPDYVYVASSWRNPVQVAVVAALRSAGIDCYDFKNPPGGTGFSWKEVTPKDSTVTTICEHCGRPIKFMRGFPEPDNDFLGGPEMWRHLDGLAGHWDREGGAVPKKGSDLVDVDGYLSMVSHPRAVDGFEEDFGAMEKADTFVLVLPCGKSAHLELGWAVGAGKRTAVLLEDPVEPELMYRMVDYLARSLFDLLGWLGVED